MSELAQQSAELVRIRAELDVIDEELLAGVARRVALARVLGREKRASGMPVTDPAREAAVVRRAATRARERGVPEERVRQLFWVLIEMTRAVQLAEADEHACLDDTCPAQ